MLIVFFTVTRMAIMVQGKFDWFAYEIYLNRLGLKSAHQKREKK